MFFEKSEEDSMEVFPELVHGKAQDGKYVFSLEKQTGKIIFSMQKLWEPGEYRIVTSNRLPNGNIYLLMYINFSIEAGQQKEITLCLRQADLEDMLKILNLQNLRIKKIEAGTEKVKASDLTARGICFWKKAGTLQKRISQ